MESNRAHLVGICGSGMSALAALLLDLGWSVTGSDLRPADRAVQALLRRGIRLYRGHDSDNVPANSKLVVHSAAVPPENPERIAAAALGIPDLSYSQALGQLMRTRRGVCIAGTHGKSTTAAMTATILQRAGLEPSACIGAELCGMDRGGWAGRGDLFVVESCEYQHSFLDLCPTLATILNIEEDHFDCFRDLEEIGAAFHQFASRVSQQGMLLVRGDCPAALAAASGTKARIEMFSLARDGDAFPRLYQIRSSGSETSKPVGNLGTLLSPVAARWSASHLRSTREGIAFRAWYNDQVFADCSLRVPGKHNALNALAAMALCHRLRVEAGEIAAALAAFPGISRRFESIGSFRGVTLVDDYAHHPTAVQSTLEAARSRFGIRRLWCVFQPHQASRTRALLDRFARSFQLADELLVAPVYQARETPDDQSRLLSQILADRADAMACRARFCRDLDQIVATLDDEARSGDVIVTMGAGDINRVHHDLTRRLQNNLAS